VSLILAIPAALASPPDLVVGAQGGLLGWQRAGNHAALIGARVSAGLRGSRLGATLGLDGALARDRNESETSAAWPRRAAATLDVVVRRRDACWVTGVGPGVSGVASRIRSGEERFGGVSAVPLLRVRSGVDAPIAGPVRWMVTTGAGLRAGGVDWDLGVGLSVQP